MPRTLFNGGQIKDGSIAQIDLDPSISFGVAVTTGTIAPTSTPSRIGDFYVNSSTGSIYMAGGTSGSFNWALIGQGSLSADYRTNLVGCWDASNGPVPTINNTTLTAWNDLGSVLNHMTVLYGTPKYMENIQNGLPAVYLSGSAGIRGANVTDIAQPTTHFLIFKPTDWNAAKDQYIAEMYNQSQIIYKSNGTANVRMYAGTTIPGDALADNNCYLTTVVFNGASSSIAVNANAAVPGNTGTGTNSMYPIIGTHDGVSFFTGYVMEWRVYTGALTSDQQTQVRVFLNNKWGIY